MESGMMHPAHIHLPSYAARRRAQEHEKQKSSSSHDKEHESHHIMSVSNVYCLHGIVDYQFSQNFTLVWTGPRLLNCLLIYFFLRAYGQKDHKIPKTKLH